MDEFRYRFITEDGTRELTHAEYLNEDDLREKVGIMARRVSGRSRLFLGKTIISYPNQWLNDRPKKREHFTLLAKEQIRNPFRFFLPHRGACLDFLNDFDHNLCTLFAPNRLGKSTINWIKKLINCAKNDPSWEIFTEHGVKYREWDGKKTLAVYSYQKSNIKDTLWPQVIQKWTPVHLLGPYSPRGTKSLSFRELPDLDCEDFWLWFKAASQSQGAFESQAVDDWYWDEQPATANFIGANERTRTCDGRHDCSGTPHKILGRADTGANGLMSKMYRKEFTLGLDPAFYIGKIDDIPDWIYPQKQKEAAYHEWVKEPQENNDFKALAEGKARYYGLPHEASGRVLDNFNRKVHLIDRFDIPSGWTRWRAVDHGRVNPTAMLNLAVSPEGIIVFYQEYYKGGLDVSDNVENIVKLCGNKLVFSGEQLRRKDGSVIKRKKEVFVGQKFAATKLDGRSFAKTLDGSSMTLGQLYRICGLNCTPASGQDSTYTVPILNDWFKIDWKRKNDFSDQMGASKAYIMRDLRHTIHEAENWIYEEPATRGAEERGNRKETPRKKNDHLMTAMLYLASANVRYIEGASDLDEEDEDRKIPVRVVDKYTGY